jgi:hypothetical protein
MTVKDIIQQVEQLSPAERQELFLYMQSMMDTQYPKTRNILEFEGVGKEIWDGIDAQEYVRQLREEWDDRP